MSGKDVRIHIILYNKVKIRQTECLTENGDRAGQDCKYYINSHKRRLTHGQKSHLYVILTGHGVIIKTTGPVNRVICRSDITWTNRRSEGCWELPSSLVGAPPLPQPPPLTSHPSCRCHLLSFVFQVRHNSSLRSPMTQAQHTRHESPSILWLLGMVLGV